MYKEITIDSIEELKERWEMVMLRDGIDEIQVTEHIPMANSNTVIVRGLAMDLEDEIAICSDYDDVLLNSRSLLLMFSQDDLSAIKLIPVDNGHKERLEFAGNEIVYIEKA